MIYIYITWVIGVIFPFANLKGNNWTHHALKVKVGCPAEMCPFCHGDTPSCHHGWDTKKVHGLSLVICYIAIEHDHSYFIYLLKTWWFYVIVHSYFRLLEGMIVLWTQFFRLSCCALVKHQHRLAQMLASSDFYWLFNGEKKQRLQAGREIHRHTKWSSNTSRTHETSIKDLLKTCEFLIAGLDHHCFTTLHPQGRTDKVLVDWNSQRTRLVSFSLLLKYLKTPFKLFASTTMYPAELRHV